MDASSTSNPTTNAAAKREMLERIRAANQGESSAQTAAAEWNTIPRDYKSTPALTPEKLLELLIDRLRDYDAEVELVSLDSIPQAIAGALAAHGDVSMLIPPGFPVGLLPAGSFMVDDNFSSSELNQFNGILTQSTLAIAETGTIVLQNVPGQGRRAATLVPDFHLCLLNVADLVESVPEAVRRLDATAHLPTTFISGPSATADIEMTRIKGVHGPRFLHVLIYGS